MYRVGVDIGGTFTDIILMGDKEDTWVIKTPTTDDLISGIAQGVSAACEQANATPQDIGSFGHGSTVALNALIEETGAETAVVTTEGFRDVLEFRDGARPASLLYNNCGEYEQPLVPRTHRYEVPERIDSAGAIETTLDIDVLDDVIDDLKQNNVESVAISFLHSYQNDEHERTVADRIKERAPELAVSFSADVSPRIREYSRTSTTAVDAYLKPTVSTYLDELQGTLEEQGLSVPINIMQSDGGLARPKIAAQRPYTQIIAGPVAGVKAAQFIGEQIGTENLMTFDMGGTSCDAALIKDGEPVFEPYRATRGMKINGPFINLVTVGAGGGSIAWLDAVDALRVGPRSAGANPGPVCYDRGGTQPTVTDADLILGMLGSDNFAGGNLDLNESAARESIREHVADPLGMSVEEAALSVRDIIDSKMASALRVISVEEGRDPRDFALMGFGGAGPMHACSVADEIGISTVIFPNNPGLLSALGLMVADIKHEYVRSVVQTIDELDLASLNETVSELLHRGANELAAEEVPPASRLYQISFDVMYAQQAHSLSIPLAAESVEPDAFELTDADIGDVAALFETEHEAKYGFVDENTPIKLADVHVTAVGNIDNPDPETEAATGSVTGAVSEKRPVLLTEEGTRREITATAYDWELLPVSSTVDGPAILEMSNSTVWITPDYHVEIDANKNAIARKENPV